MSLLKMVQVDHKSIFWNSENFENRLLSKRNLKLIRQRIDPQLAFRRHLEANGSPNVTEATDRFWVVEVLSVSSNKPNLELLRAS